MSNSKPKARRSPKHQKGSLFTVVTDPINVAPEGNIDQLTYASVISPRIKFSNRTHANPLTIYCANYEKVQFLESVIELVTLTSENVVSGYTISLAWFPDASESPTSLQETNLQQTGFVRSLQPGQSGKLALPKGHKILAVDPQHKQPTDAFHGLLLVVVHGVPINNYNNTRYVGPLFKLRMDFTVKTFGYSPGNISIETHANEFTEDAVVEGEGGKASIVSNGALALSRSAGEPDELSGTGAVIYQAVMTTAETVAGVLPFPLNIIARVGLFFVRKVVGANGEPRFLMYKDYQSAVVDAPIVFRGRVSLGETKFGLNALSAPGPDPAPMPVPTFNMRQLRSSGTYELLVDITGDVERVGTNYPVEECKFLRVTDMATGAFTTDFSSPENWQIDGVGIPVTSSYGFSAFRIFDNINPVKSDLPGWVLFFYTNTSRLLVGAREPTTPRTNGRFKLLVRTSSI